MKMLQWMVVVFLDVVEAIEESLLTIPETAVAASVLFVSKLQMLLPTLPSNAVRLTDKALGPPPPIMSALHTTPRSCMDLHESGSYPVQLER